MNSEGDPRVLFIMNLVLSFVFSWAVVSGLEFIGVIEYSWSRVAVATIALMIMTYMVVR